MKTFKEYIFACSVNESADNILRFYKSVYETMLKCLRGAAVFKCTSQLTKMYGEQFNHMATKSVTVHELAQTKTYAKRPWVTYLFTNQSMDVTFEIALTGDTNYKILNMCDGETDFDDLNGFDFEWSLAVNVYRGSSHRKEVVCKEKKFKRSDLSILKEGEKMLPSAKLKKIVI